MKQFIKIINIGKYKIYKIQSVFQLLYSQFEYYCTQKMKSKDLSKKISLLKN